MPKYKLYYYNGRGLAEVPRWLFAVAGQPYDDVRLGDYCSEHSEGHAFKSCETIIDFLDLATPFGQLPVLDVDDLRIAQSNTIVNFLARELDLAGKSLEERVRVSMVVDYVNEIVFKAYMLNFENDETKKAALKKSLEENFKSQFPYLEKFTESYGTRGYLIGDSISLADVSFAVGIEKLGDFNLEYHLENYPRLKQAYDNILAHPGIVAWLAKRPVTKT